MIRYNHPAAVLEFLQSDPVRYRLLIHDLDPPCPAWDDAMRRCDYVHGVGFLLWPTAAVAGPSTETDYYVDSTSNVSLVAAVRGDHSRIEGCAPTVRPFDLIEWLAHIGVRSITTYAEKTRNWLSAVCPLTWKLDGADYTVSRETFRPCDGLPVRCLTPGDHWLWREFVRQNAADPMVNGHCGSQAVVRDFVFMCSGLPVDYYAAFEGDKIAGVATVNPMTHTIDEIGMLFVAPGYRRRGFARGLVSAATSDILARGHQPAYHAGGNPTDRPDLYNLLSSLGYWLVGCPWWASICESK